MTRGERSIKGKGVDGMDRGDDLGGGRVIVCVERGE